MLADLDAFVLASLIVPFIVTLGAVPLCAHLLAAWGKKGHALQTSTAHRLNTAGLAIYIGIAVAAFYLDAWPREAMGLALSAMAVLIAGTAIDAAARHGLLSRYGLFAKLLLSLAVTLGVWVDLNSLPAWPLVTLVLIGAGVLVLVAMERIGYGHDATSPGLTIYLTLAAMAGLLLVSAVGTSQQVIAADANQTMKQIALPAFGGLLAAAYYMVRLPWRPAPVVFVGTGGHMMLAVASVWMALTLALSAHDPARAAAALIWPVSVPLFSALRQRLQWVLHDWLKAQAAQERPANALVSWLHRHLSYYFAPGLLPAVTLALSVLGAWLLHDNASQAVHWFSWFSLLAAFILVPAYISHTRLGGLGIRYRPDPYPGAQPGLGSSSH